MYIYIYTHYMYMYVCTDVYVCIYATHVYRHLRNDFAWPSGNAMSPSLVLMKIINPLISYASPSVISVYDTMWKTKLLNYALISFSPPPSYLCKWCHHLSIFKLKNLTITPWLIFLSLPQSNLSISTSPSYVWNVI